MRLILSGEADEIKVRVKAEHARRISKVRKTLEGFEFKSDLNCPFVWIRLPEPWVPSTFCKAARAHNVVIEEADEFKVGQIDRVIPNVRLAVTGELAAERVGEGLAAIHELLHQPALAYDTSE